MAKKKPVTIDLKVYLGIISIIAFLGVFLNSFTGLAVDKWVDGLLYVIMGVALMIAGGIMLFFEYFKDGLTTDEVSKILTTLVGVASFFTGVSIFLEINSPIILSTRAIVAVIAIVIIAADLVTKK